MKALSVAILGLALAGFATPALSASETDCKSMWEKADANKDGTLDGSEVAAYIDAIKTSGKTYDTNTDGKLTSAEFTEACKADTFKNIKS